MKKKSICCAFLALLLSACGKPTATGPVKTDTATANVITKEIEKERSETHEWLKSSPTSYLAAVDRVDFGQKPALSVGRAEENDPRHHPRFARVPRPHQPRNARIIPNSRDFH